MDRLSYMFNKPYLEKAAIRHTRICDKKGKKKLTEIDIVRNTKSESF